MSSARVSRANGTPSSGSRARLIVSPHLDDAMLSAWHGVTEANATVVTVFAGVPEGSGVVPAWDRICGAEDPTALMRSRRANDEQAITAQGAEVVHLDFLDDQYREGAAPRQAIIDALKELLRGHDEVWLPAGIGGHPDHRVAAEAALAASVSVPRVIYADQPYISREWSSVLTPTAGAPAGPEAWTTAVLRTCPYAPPRIPLSRSLAEHELAMKRAALSQYTSQLPALIKTFPDWWSNPSLFNKEWIWELPPGDPHGPPLLRLLGGLTDPMERAQDEQPFLSVILRTTGTRPQLMHAALDSLARQTDRDFELLVVAHNAGEGEMAGIRGQLRGLPQWMSARTRLFQARGGTRSRPLNVGLSNATGRYVAVLDDDDLALCGWVEEFARLERGHRGMVLRTRVARARGGREELVYPESFDLIDHLVGNQTPVCGLAFPMPWLTALGITVDESLEVVEDWDLLLRTAPLCGVAASAAVTSQYRETNGDDSRSRHSDTAWEVAQRTVIDKANEKPILLPPGSVRTLRHERERLAELEARLPVLESERDVAQNELTATREELAAETQRSAELAKQYAVIAGSTSWRVTAPLRRAAARARRRRPLPAEASASAARVETQRADQHDSVTSARSTVPVEYFEALYAENRDPWGYESEWYEQRKYALTIGALLKKRYRRAFEPGCSIGVLTALLATRCDGLVSVDCVMPAVDRARDRLREMPWVEVEQMAVPDQWPPGTFDLIVISELGRYLSDHDLGLLIDRSVNSLEHEGHVVLVHHRARGFAPQSAEAVHHAFAARPELVELGSHTEPEFLIAINARASA